MKTSDLFKMGYAIPLYGIDTHTWRHFDQEIKLPHGALEIITKNGIPCALWENVQRLKADAGINVGSSTTRRSE